MWQRSWGVTACFKGRHRWKCRERSGGLDLDVFLPTPTRSFRFFLVAGIEANIPVTYGIGSQRKNQSTGCQFIGQSPVHSILAAADSLSVSGLRTAVSLLGWLWLLFLRGYQPPPQITAAPLEPVGTSTWSCCYRRWEPLWSGHGCRHLLSGRILGRAPQLPVHPCLS